MLLITLVPITLVLITLVLITLVGLVRNVFVDLELGGGATDIGGVFSIVLVEIVTLADDLGKDTTWEVSGAFLDDGSVGQLVQRLVGFKHFDRVRFQCNLLLNATKVCDKNCILLDFALSKHLEVKQQ